MCGGSPTVGNFFLLFFVCLIFFVLGLIFFAVSPKSFYHLTV